MKLFFALLMLNCLGYAALADSSPRFVNAVYSKVYIPRGFDNNDNVQIAAEGIFPNTCLKIAAPDIHVDEVLKRVTINPKAYMYGGICLFVIVPYQQTLDLGIIKTPGTYSVQTSLGVEMGKLEVAKSKTARADDYLYAPVQRVSFLDDAKNEVNLRIEFSNDCMTLDEVKVDKQENVVVLQPISTFHGRENCAYGYFPITQTVQLGQLPKGRYLLHVRSSGSQAKNEIIAVE